MAASTLTALILAIFSVISLAIFSAAEEAEAVEPGTDEGDASIRKTVRITFEEAVFGCEKELDVILKDPCPKCNGTGAKPGTTPETCPKCGGKGQVVYSTAVTLRYGAECTDLSGLSWNW